MKEKVSVLHASKASLWYRQWWAIALAGIFLLGSLAYFFKDSLIFQGQDPVVRETYTIKKGNVKVSVEGEGKIMNPNIVNLSFLVDGTLDTVLVKEGDKVKKGDLLAELDKRQLEFDLQNAQGEVQITNANIRSKKAEITDDSIRVAENDIIVSQQNLETAQKDLEQSLNQSLDLGSVEIETTFPEIRKALESIDSIFGVDKNYTQYEAVQYSFNDSIRQNSVKEGYDTLKRAQASLWDEYSQRKPLSDSDVPRFLLKLKDLSTQTQGVLEDVVNLFDTIGAVGPGTTESQIKEAESSIKSSLSSINSAVSTLTTTRQKIENASLAREKGLIDAENSVNSTQIKLENTQKDFEKREITKDTSLSILYAQLAQSQIKVEKAKYNLGQTSLISPIDGEVIVVNGNPGETVKVQSTSSENALIRILSDANFTTEIYVEEVDIAKIKKGQKALITMDAIEGVTLQGEVSYIASIATTDSNGITTYLVRVDIANNEEVPIKEGMSTYVEFLLENAEDVLVIPVSSVKDNRVQLEDGQTVSVETGVTDGKDIEIKNGLTEGQVIFVKPQFEGNQSSSQQASGGSAKGAGAVTSEERMQRVEALLKEQGKLPEGWDKMSTDEKQAALQKLREGAGVGASLLGGSARPGGSGGGGMRGGGGGMH
ncbi:efflux RND transporter periplasmic adaptor subunit [Candidatus Gracilibacteria bacterium]|nr:efflux RND transporter periplasmic adaptor subunit [Candidatus Gracilibacteria bacterium]